MSKKPRLSQLANELKTSNSKIENKVTQETIQNIISNPERGKRGDFLKATITISAELLGELKQMGLRRRARGLKDTDVSSLVREAVVDLIKKEISSYK